MNTSFLSPYITFIRLKFGVNSKFQRRRERGGEKEKKRREREGREECYDSTEVSDLATSACDNNL